MELFGPQITCNVPRAPSRGFLLLGPVFKLYEQEIFFTFRKKKKNRFEKKKVLKNKTKQKRNEQTQLMYNIQEEEFTRSSGGLFWSPRRCLQGPWVQQ